MLEKNLLHAPLNRYIIDMIEYKETGAYMFNFTYFTPTKVVFGKETENQIGALVAEQKCKKVLIH